MALRTKEETQDSTLVYYASLRSYTIIKEHRDLKFANHPSMSSEYIKVLCHNYSFELVKSMQIDLIALETEFKDYRTKFSFFATTNSTKIQRADETNKGSNKLTKVVTKIENKK